MDNQSLSALQNQMDAFTTMETLVFIPFSK